MISDYTPNVYVDDSAPAVSAANLNALENQMRDACDELQRLAGDPALPNTAIALDAQVKAGDWTYLGADGAFLTDLDWMIGYVGSGIYFDGTDWQVPGSAQGNGWAVIGVHADGHAYLYSDTSTGNGARSYTKAQFLALRGSALGASAPSLLAQEGAADGDVVTWDDGLGQYAPAPLPTTAAPVVGTTIAGLGSAVDGTIGLLRLGTTPYTFITVHYDATYGKWVSEESVGSVFHATTDTTVSSGSAFADAMATGAMAGIPQAWRVLDNGGLTPQFRVIGVFVQAGAGTLTVQPAYRGQDAASTTAGSGVGVTTVTATSTQTADVALDTGWGDIVAGYTVKDFITASLMTKQSGANNVKISGASSLGLGTVVRMRWVG